MLVNRHLKQNTVIELTEKQLEKVNNVTEKLVGNVQLLALCANAVCCMYNLASVSDRKLRRIQPPLGTPSCF